MKLAIIGDLKNGTNCTAVDCYLLKDHGTFHKKPRTSAYCWRYLSHFGQESEIIADNVKFILNTSIKKY